jgi:hypothetical protein
MVQARLHALTCLVNAIIAEVGLEEQIGTLLVACDTFCPRCAK